MPENTEQNTEHITAQLVRATLASVIDPEINRSIADLNMIGDIHVDNNNIDAEIKLTIAGCPWRVSLEETVRQKLNDLPGVGTVNVNFTPMTKEELDAVKLKLRGPEPEIPFNKPGNKTHIIGIASGKGGVGKSSITANLAVALARKGYKVGVLDADIYGFSQPRMLGTQDHPTLFGDNMLLPPISQGVKVISTALLLETPNQPVAMRGPMLHGVLSTYLSQVYWDDLDFLLLDMPPGTGDIAISVAQLLPKSKIVVVTTPQTSAAEVAQRAGILATKTGQQIIGVIENMSWLIQPDGSKLDIFGNGGGQEVAENLSLELSQSIPLLGQVPIDAKLREGSDTGNPIVLSDSESPAAEALLDIVDKIVAIEAELEPAASAATATQSAAPQSTATSGAGRTATSNGWRKTGKAS
jgi:ATP-binding protein involved in chromosome partitioning